MTTDELPQTPAEVPDGAQPADATDAQDDGLGDGGKRALAALRSEVKELKAQLKNQASSPSGEGERDAADAAGTPSEGAMPADADAGQVTTTAEDVKPTPPRFQGTADGGATRGTPAGARQLTADDLRSMGPRAVDKARRAGQLRDLLSGR